MRQWIKQLFCFHHWTVANIDYVNDREYSHFVQTKYCTKCGKIKSRYYYPGGAI